MSGFPSGRMPRGAECRVDQRGEPAEERHRRTEPRPAETTTGARAVGTMEEAWRPRRPAERIRPRRLPERVRSGRRTKAAGQDEAPEPSGQDDLAKPVGVGVTGDDCGPGRRPHEPAWRLRPAGCTVGVLSFRPWEGIAAGSYRPAVRQHGRARAQRSGSQGEMHAWTPPWGTASVPRETGPLLRLTCRSLRQASATGQSRLSTMTPGPATAGGLAAPTDALRSRRFAVVAPLCRQWPQPSPTASCAAGGTRLPGTPPTPRCGRHRSPPKDVSAGGARRRFT